MGFFSNLFSEKTDDNSKSVSQQKEVVLEDEKWESIPKWIKVDDQDEKKKIAILASSVANFDDNGKEYILNGIEKRNPEYRKLAIIIASTVNFMYPNSEHKIVSIKKIK